MLFSTGFTCRSVEICHLGIVLKFPPARMTFWSEETQPPSTLGLSLFTMCHVCHVSIVLHRIMRLCVTC